MHHWQVTKIAHKIENKDGSVIIVKNNIIL